MLSILIPTYQYNSLPLVRVLHKQGKELDISFEIICFEDGSNTNLYAENLEINKLSNATFKKLESNIGRSKIRNLLIAKSKYKYCLFIDGDSMIYATDYLQRYINLLPFEGIIYGGRRHQDYCPSGQQSLRWKYGKFVEDKSASIRLKSPYTSLLFNNTLVNKACFKSIEFDRSIRTYGHEDTVIAYHSELNDITIQHIDNFVIHENLENNDVFLNKTHFAITNLYQLSEQKKIPYSFVKLLRYFRTLERLRLRKLISKLYLIFKYKIDKNLKSTNPSLLLFKFLKLGYICCLNEKN